MFASAGAADKVMINVPDWNQPDNYAAATPGLNVGDCPQWCSPTAAADLMGYWDDVKGCAGLTDGQPPSAFPNPANQVPCWQQNLWHDGTVELGWFMNTGLWQGMGPPPMFPPKAGVTGLGAIGPGAVAYAIGAWNDPNGAVKVAFPNANNSLDNAFNAQMWANYKADIDANKPVLVSFEYWLDVSDPGAMGTKIVDGQVVEIWPLNPLGTGHTVCGVGYVDPTPNQWIGDEEMVVQDNWSATGQYVLAPIWAQVGWWQQNDYIFVPEPMTLGLLLAGGMVLIRRRK
ncbi:MAG: hypothetical protein AMJ81_01915 [Phycisphaerae bacterium SM23_33]|nr:MAG: hypothetical protein AMJ81_01915 [Phycisphaerae bacterium SM23_33]